MILSLSGSCSSAPFFNTLCLPQVSRECSDPTIASVIEHDIYVDNLATGSSTEEGIKHIQVMLLKI